MKVIDHTTEAARIRTLAAAQCDAHEIACVMAKELELPYEGGIELVNRYVDDGTVLIEAEAGRAALKERLYELAVRHTMSKEGPKALSVLAGNYLGFTAGGLADHINKEIRAQQRERTRATSRLSKGTTP